jgi:hypothetical protein
MGIVVFIVLGGGKVGLYMTSLLVVYTFVGSADIAMKVTSNQEAEQPLSTPDLHRTLVKRGVCWLAIGALLGLSTVLWFNTYEPDPTSEVWQLEAILCAAVYYTCILMSARMMFQVHRDKQANVWRLLCFLLGSQLLRDIGDCSPYRLLSAAGTVLYLLTTTVGVYVVVMHLDSEAELSTIKNGYTFLCACIPYEASYISLKIMSSPLDPLISSAFLMSFQKVGLKLVVPVAKRCWGDDERKRWTYVMPTILLGLELPACLLFLQSTLISPSFWYLLIFQEWNSVMNNTGYYTKLYLFVRETIGRPVSDDTRNAMEDSRCVLAPCDNIAEIASPVVIGIAVALSGLFDVFGFDRAPYLADKGLFDAWQVGHNQFRGEVPIMLLVVLVFRVLFCMIEIKLRSLKHSKETSTVDAPSSTPEAAGGAREKRRRSSMSVLYD